ADPAAPRCGACGFFLYDPYDEFVHDIRRRLYAGVALRVVLRRRDARIFAISGPQEQNRIFAIVNMFRRGPALERSGSYTTCHAVRSRYSVYWRLADLPRTV